MFTAIKNLLYRSDPSTYDVKKNAFVSKILFMEMGYRTVEEITNHDPTRIHAFQERKRLLEKEYDSRYYKYKLTHKEYSYLYALHEDEKIFTLQQIIRSLLPSDSNNKPWLSILISIKYKLPEPMHSIPIQDLLPQLIN